MSVEGQERKQLGSFLLWGNQWATFAAASAVVTSSSRGEAHAFTCSFVVLFAASVKNRE